MAEWQQFVKNQMQLGGHDIPSPKLVCIDLQPNATAQAQECASVLNIGGFSDQMFEVIAAFAEGRLGADHWVGVIESVQL